MPDIAYTTEQGFAPLNTQNVRTKDRVRDLAEVFTAQREVEAMLDLVGDPSHNPDLVVLEPSCGNGNFLVAVLDQGWHDVDLESFFPGKSILGNEQMHLTQSQVRDLLPLLGHFVRTGYLPDEPLPAPTRAEDGVLPCPFCGGTQADGTLEFSHGQKYVVHAESEVCSAFRGVLVPRAQWNTRAPMSVEEKSE